MDSEINMKKRKIYGGNLRTITVTDTEIAAMLSVTDYAIYANYSRSAVYYAIYHGFLVAKKFGGQWYILPERGERRNQFL